MATMSRRTFLMSSAVLLASSSYVKPVHSEKSNALPAKFDLDRFTEDVKRARAEDDSQKAVEEVIARAVSDRRAVLRALGEPQQAQVETLYRDSDVSIFNLVWAPRMVLMPHNHLMWASIGVYTGREDNIMWERTGQTIQASTATALSNGEVFSLPSDAIHSVVNPINRLSGAIHVYGGDLTVVKRSQWDPETLREQPFDFEEGRRLFREANERLNVGR